MRFWKSFKGLRTARYMEPFGLAVSLLAYGGQGGPELGYRFVRP